LAYFIEFGDGIMPPMANIGFIQHRLGRTDGVSLEVDKFRKVLENAGHSVFYLAGNDDVPGGEYIPELYPFDPVTQKILLNATRELKDYANPADLMEDVREQADRIKPGMLKFIRDHQLDLIFPNNLLSVGYNLPGMLALNEAIEETGIKTVCHNHDFWWEDSGEVYPTCDEVIQFYEQYAPPVFPNVSHIVINRIAQAELKDRKGVDSRVVPNVFDFSQAMWRKDDYNSDFRDSLGIKEGDIVLLQATRILDRKGVELAIDLIAQMQTPANRRSLESVPLFDRRKFGPGNRIILLCAGYVEGIGLSGGYPDALRAKADKLGVEIIWCGEQVKHSRGTIGAKKTYSLWDAYTAADFVTYPSYWEGWGNQFIEAIFAKLPVVIFEYPVYVSDLKRVGFDVVSLGKELGPRDEANLVTVDPSVIENAALETITLLQAAGRRSLVVEKNFTLAREHFSYTALEGILREIFRERGIGW
jgi:glycosyltransferase involved in cell wall biosynthesis